MTAFAYLLKEYKRFLVTSSKADNMSDELPCIAVAVRGKNAIKTLISIIGPRDPILARMTDRGSLNALYGEQISKQRGDVTVPTGTFTLYFVNSLHCLLVTLNVHFSDINCMRLQN